MSIGRCIPNGQAAERTTHARNGAVKQRTVRP